MVGMSTLPDTKSGGPLNDGVPFRHPDTLVGVIKSQIPRYW